MPDPAPKAGAKAPIPYPSNWSKMSGAEKRQWEEKNRGKKPAPRPVAPPKQYAPTPAPAPAPVEEQTEEQPAEEQPAEQGYTTEGGAADHMRFTFTLPGREPVEACAATFLPKLLRELADAFEAQAQEVKNGMVDSEE